jgi:MFS transporter, Spinster family, sphingosine-1-phosphate transporter
LVIVLLLINIINYLDRSLIGTLGDPIERDLHLTDGQLGIVGGVAFMVVYTFMALPLARWADRGHRKHVIVGSILVWCLMTSMCGFAKNFYQLTLARVGMAMGEAGVLPASQALLADRFPPHRLGIVLALFWMGTTLGDALGPLAGGWLNDLVSWRATFIILGSVGLLAAPLAAWVVREPASLGAPGKLRAAGPSLMASIRFLWSNPSYRLLWIGAALTLAAPSAYGLYVVPYFMRAHHMASGQIGALMGPLMMIAGVLAAPLGGWLYDHLGQVRPERGLAAPILALAMSGSLAVAAWHAASWKVGVTFFALAVFCHMIVVAPIYSLAQLLTPVGMRATSAAFFNMGMTMLGGTLGPLIAGAASDAFRPQWGTRSLAPALSLMAAFQFGGAVMFAWTAVRLRADRRAIGASND